MAEKPTYKELEQRVKELEQEAVKRKQTEEELRESEEKYRYLYNLLRLMCDNVPDLIWAKDMDGRFTFVNQAMCDKLIMCGSPDKALGKTDMFFAEQERNAGYEHTFGETCVDSDAIIKEKRAPGRFLEDGLVRNKYLVLDVHKAPFLNEDGEMIGTVGCGRDVTKEKEIEEALRDSEARLEALSEASFEAIFLSEKGVCLDQNQTAERMFGYTRAEAVVRHGTKWIVPDDREQVKNNMLSGYEKPYEVTALRKDGTTFPCEIQARMTDYQGRSIRITALRDITDRKRAENEMQKAKEELEAKVKERTARLEEMNAALHVLLKKREQDKDDIESKILSNVKILIKPYLHALKKISLNKKHQEIVQILETNINEIISPFTRKMSTLNINLSHMEVQVANLVRQGKTNKEISQILSIASKTVAFHRNNIRRKLGLTNTKTNLRSFLSALP